MTPNDRVTPDPPVCPNGKCGMHKPELDKNRLGVCYHQSYYSRLERSEELLRVAEHSENDELALQAWMEALAIAPNPKSAAQIAKRHKSNGDDLLALAFEGLAYALNPSQDQGAIRFANTLYQMGEIDRSADIVCETISRNESYGPAWKLKQLMEATP